MRFESRWGSGFVRSFVFIYIYIHVLTYGHGLTMWFKVK